MDHVTHITTILPNVNIFEQTITDLCYLCSFMISLFIVYYAVTEDFV